MSKENDNEVTFDSNKFFNEMNDYSVDDQETDELDFSNMVSQSSVEVSNNDEDDLDDLFVGKDDVNEESGQGGYNLDLPDENYDDNTLTAAEMLNDLVVEDDKIIEVDDDFNIQEDIVLDVKDKKFDFKIIIAIAIFILLCVIIFFGILVCSKYTIVNDHIKNSDWSNDSISLVDKTYKIDVKDLNTGDLVLYCENNGDFFKKFKYATVIDDSLKNPMKIKCYINETASTAYLNIENIYYIVDTDNKQYDYVNIGE